MPQYSVEQKYQAVGAFRLSSAIREIPEVLNLPTPNHGVGDLKRKGTAIEPPVQVTLDEHQGGLTVACSGLSNEPASPHPSNFWQLGVRLYQPLRLSGDCMSSGSLPEDLLFPLADTTPQDDSPQLGHGEVPLSIRTFKEHAGIRSIPWPARSPDLNPIEHLWDTLKRRIRQRSPQPGSLQQLSAAAIEEWNAIPQAAIDHLIGSMTSRVGAVIQAEGGATKY